MLRILRFIFLVAVLLIVGGVVGSVLRVTQLEQGELDYQSEVRTLAELEEQSDATRVSVRLCNVELSAGEEVFFEVCSQDQMHRDHWLNAFEFVVWQLSEMKPVLRVPLDDAHLELVKRDGQEACLALGGGQIPNTGHYALDAVWIKGPPSERVMHIGLSARVMGRTLLSSGERLYVLMIAMGTLLGLLALFFYTYNLPQVSDQNTSETAFTPIDDDLKTERRRNLTVLLIGLCCASLVWGMVTWLPLWGPTMGLIKGLGLAVAEIGIAIYLARYLYTQKKLQKPELLTNLSLKAPSQAPWLGLAMAIVSGGVLFLCARLALDLIPSTERAPIQTFVSWPSGMLSFATLGVIVPLSEEIFFRGFIYRAARSLGKRFAFVVTVLLFVALHAQQTWGNWGGLTAILITGTILTALRAWSGSTLVPCVAHLLYNTTLSMSSF